MRIDDAVCPHEDGLTAIVILSLSGRDLKLRCTPAAYANAKPGQVGIAYGNARLLAEFRSSKPS
jgi:hypothetical protein